MNTENLDRQPVPPTEATSPTPLPDLEPPQKLPYIRLVAPLFIQFLLICSVSARSIYALATGTTVVLKTAPVDPYDLLRGYYQTLSYDISSFSTLDKLAGWGKLLPKGRANLARNQQVYVTLIKNHTSDTSLHAWQPIAIDDKIPTNLSATKIAIRGVSDGNSIIYGLETYYMPEDRKDDVNNDVNAARSSGDRRNLLVEIKVDNRGLATPVSLWVGAKQYRF
jgi:uncharacterized membrane-anchored protein